MNCAMNRTGGPRYLVAQKPQCCVSRMNKIHMGSSGSDKPADAGQLWSTKLYEYESNARPNAPQCISIHRVV